jgi:hypothetical protein
MRQTSTAISASIKLRESPGCGVGGNGGELRETGLGIGWDRSLPQLPQKRPPTGLAAPQTGHWTIELLCGPGKSGVPEIPRAGGSEDMSRGPLVNSDSIRNSVTCALPRCKDTV